MAGNRIQRVNVGDIRRNMSYTLKGSSVASILTLVLVSICSVSHAADHETAAKGIRPMEQPANDSGGDMPLPPLDRNAPKKTKTATFALG